ncbi:MAG: glycosyltransferase family 39 protein [Candidatus Diapherotrites archaeon]
MAISGYLKCLIALAAIAAIFYSLALDGFIEGGDSTKYAVGALALAQGKGYADISVPVPAPFTYYPPLTSLLMAPFAFFGYNALALKIPALLASALSVIVAGMLFRRFFGPRLSLMLAAVFAFCLPVLWYSHKALSDAPFVLLSLLAVFFATEHVRLNSRLSAALAVVFTALSCLTRVAGLALIPALPIFLSLRGRPKAGIAFSLAALLLISPWLIYPAFFPESGEPSYLGLMFAKNIEEYSSGYASGTLSVQEVAARSVSFASFYLFSSIPETVFPPLGAARWVFGANPLAALPIAAAGIAVFAVFAAGMLSARRESGFARIYLLIYLAALFIYPYIDTSAVNRFLLPVLPLLLLFFADGLLLASSVFREKTGISPKTSSALVFAVIALMLFAGFSSCVYYLATQHERNFDGPYTNLLLASEWVRENAPQGALLWSPMPQRVFLLTGRHTIKEPAETADELLSAWKRSRVSYALLVDYSDSGRTAAEAAIAQGFAEAVYSAPDGKTKVLKVINGVPAP